MITDAIDPDPHASDPVPNPTLDQLRSEVDDETVAHFVADFLALLDDRVAQLAELVAQQCTEDAITALLSLETSGAMVGARRLATAAEGLRHVVAHGEWEAAAPLVDDLRVRADEAKVLLTGQA